MMAIIPAPDIYGWTVFCDDIREEAGGKHSFMGVYAGNMIIHVPFPVTLPTFAMGVTVCQRRSIFTPSFSLLVFLPGDPDNTPSVRAEFHEVSQGKIAKETPAQRAALHPDAQGEMESEYVNANAHLKLSQFAIKQPGRIKVRAIIADNTYPVGSLRVSPPPQNESTASASQPPS